MSDDAAEGSRQFPTIAEVIDTLDRIVADRRLADGSMPSATFLEISRDEMRHLYAAHRYLDELSIIREAKRAARSRP